jgi:HEAT repeat protein
LGDFDDAAALPALRAAIDDESERVRLWAIRSLGRLQDRESVERLMGMLVRLLDDSNPAVRRAATEALHPFGLT